MNVFEGKVVFITGATRGIGREIALACARQGARIAVTGKTVTPHKVLPGTLHSVAEEIRALGGEALELPLDVRDCQKIKYAVDATVEQWGGIDILVNNAGAISLQPMDDLPIERFDLMMSINVRAVLACAQACMPYLKKAQNPHILNLSPPISLDPRWYGPHVGYTISKFGMSMCTIGLAEELKSFGVGVNSLWPATLIATMAIKVNFPQLWPSCRLPTIVADAAEVIFKRQGKLCTGNHFIDEAVLREEGISDFSQYAVDPAVEPAKDLFV